MTPHVYGTLYPVEHWTAVCRFRALLGYSSDSQQYWDDLDETQRAILGHALESLVRCGTDPGPCLAQRISRYDTMDDRARMAIVGSCAWLQWRLYHGLPAVQDDGDLVWLAAEAEYGAARLFMRSVFSEDVVPWSDLESQDRLQLIEKLSALLPTAKDPFVARHVAEAIASTDNPRDRVLVAVVIAHGSLLWRMIHAIRGTTLQTTTHH